MSASKLRVAWAEFLRPYPWELFVTLTFDQKRHRHLFAQQPEKPDKDFRCLIRFMNEQLYGRRWLRKTKHKGVIWARVQERHAGGELHYHACVYAPSQGFSESLVFAIRAWWEARFGMARAEKAISKDAVVRYLTKHAGDPNQAEIDLSNNFSKLA